MYARLVLRNVKRSVKDYLIYIVTLTICVTLFYGFLSISSKYYTPDIGVEFNLTMLSDGMKLAICLITSILLFLIRYVNNYMISRKQKEFALQTIMGMEQGTTAKLFFAETLIMGALSIFFGIILGMVCSQFVTAMLLSSYGQPFYLSWTLFPDTMLITILFFAGTFLLVGLWNIRAIRKIKIMDMLNADKKNEADFRRSRYMPVILSFYGIMLLFMLATGISKMASFFDFRYAVPVHIMFWGNIAVPMLALLFLPVWFFKRKKWQLRRLLWGWMFCSAAAACLAAGVPALSMKYYLPLESPDKNQYLLFLCADLIFFICCLIYLANDIISLIKEKLPVYRYKGENLFFYGQIISKLKTTTKTMTLICLTLVFSICLFMAVPALVGWASGYLDSRSVYDIQIFSMYNRVYEKSDLPAGSYEQVTEFLDKNQIAVVDDCTFSLYLPIEEDFHQRIKYKFPVVAISLSDYNHILSMRGYDPICLSDDEFAVQWDPVAAEEDRREFSGSHASLLTDNGSLQLAADGQYQYALGETLSNSYTDMVYILPDRACENLLPVMRNRYITTAEPLPFEKSLELEKLFAQSYPEQDIGPSYNIRTRTQQVNSTKAGNFVMQTSMTYGALVLFVMCFTILSLQQLADVGHYRYRFGVLHKIGVEKSHINRLIFRQLSVWFGFPVILAALLSGILISYFFKVISAQISAYIGGGILLGQVGIIVSILIVLLFCYYISTWILFKHSINS